MNTTTITSIQRGIVFLMAEWSGPAIQAYQKLLDCLKQRGIPPEQLYILNIDYHPELNDVPELAGKIHGWGEAAIVKAGKITFVIVLGKDQHQIQQNCDELLRVYSA